MCWRALRLQVPAPADSGEAWLAWTSLALFALMDDEGDLDRFPMRAAIAATPAKHLREVETLVRAVRCAPVCCKTREGSRGVRGRISALAPSAATGRHQPRVLLAVQCSSNTSCSTSASTHDQRAARSHTATLRECASNWCAAQPGCPELARAADRLERVLMPNSPASRC